MPAVADSVYVLPLDVDRGGDVHRFNPSAVETDSGIVLLDVGFPHSLDQLEAGLADAGYGLADVELVVLTHHDGDHASGLSTLLERTDALVAAHEAEVPYVDGRESIRTAAGPMELLHTPGHSPGHLSAYLPEAKVLVAADAMVSEDGLAGPKEVYTPDMDTAVESVGRLADLDVETVVCYHGGAVEATGEDVAAIYSSLQA